MTKNVTLIAKAMKDHYGQDEAKIRKFVNVYTLAKSIGELEKLPEATQEYLEIEAIVYSAESPNKDTTKADFLKDMMKKLDIDYDIIERVVFVADNFYEFDRITGLDHQILLEAHKLVEFKECRYPKDKIIKETQNYFITNYGKAFVKRAFNV